jgi:hypothetical protein
MISENLAAFVFGILIAALFNILVLKEEVDNINLEAVMLTIEKCPNSEYDRIEVRAKWATYLHADTDVYCTDGSFVSTNVRIVKNNDKTP